MNLIVIPKRFACSNTTATIMLCTASKTDIQLWCALINHTERIFHFYFIIIKECVINRECTGHFTDTDVIAIRLCLYNRPNARAFPRSYMNFIMSMCDRLELLWKIQNTSLIGVCIRCSGALSSPSSPLLVIRSGVTLFSHCAVDDELLCGLVVWSGLPLWCPPVIMDMLFRMPY